MRVEPSAGVTGMIRSQPGTRGVRSSHRGASLGLKFKSTSDVISQLDRGFPFRALEALAANSGLALKDLAAAIGISSRTLARRRAGGYGDSGRDHSPQAERRPAVVLAGLLSVGVFGLAR